VRRIIEQRRDVPDGHRGKALTKVIEDDPPAPERNWGTRADETLPRCRIAEQDPVRRVGYIFLSSEARPG
jgi:hypothetical protein